MRKALLVVLGAGLVLYGVAQHVVNKKAAAELEQQLTAVEEKSGISVSYNSLDASLFTDKVSLQGVAVTDAKQRQIVSAERVSLEGYQKHKVSELTEVSLIGVHLSDFYKKQFPDLPPLLQSSRVDFSFSLSFERSTSKSAIKVSLGARDVMAANLSVQLQNMTPLMEASQRLMQQPSDSSPAQLSALQNSALEALQRAQLDTVQFSVQNKGQLQQLFTELLLGSALDRGDFYQMLETQLHNAQMAQRTKKALLAFARGLQRLDVSLQLPQGTSMGELSEQVQSFEGEPEAFADHINLQITGQ
ncbi:hypothetical protein PA25_26870 [Pseudoalteromonas sp. A25]|uniref:hypothetical protein n=1 Tax=Pseudoalteromonas sp. A25 TaxID=116092 RepID=UPI001260EB08|nr:hypothetical protein [Pseudoalteromonas sp. A25]BBN82702.1 hypothetical protein PA25_26870 [Pseudoalteromonas sp. A25]